MSAKELFVIGIGGHAKVVAETAQVLGWSICAFIDEKSSATTYREREVYRSLEEAKAQHPHTQFAFIAIGSNENRKRWYNFLIENDYTLPTLLHPSAVISTSAVIDAGTLVCANSVVGAECHIREGVIINTGAIVDHDTAVGAFTHVSQGAIACGGVQIGAECLIGPGTVIEKLSCIPDNTQISSPHSINYAK